MNTRELIEMLSDLPESLEVEIGSQHRPNDEWYELEDVVLAKNYRGRTVVLLHMEDGS